MSASDHLLMVVDPVARRSDGESVRIAKDVLSARAVTKVCLPQNPAEFAKALAKRGARRVVVVGDDRALLRTVTLLHRERELASCALSLVPVGTAVSLAHSLGVPVGAVAAARAVLQGVVRRLDLLTDDDGGVVLRDLRIPPGSPAVDGAADGPGWLRRGQSLVRTLTPFPQRRGLLGAPPAGSARRWGNGAAATPTPTRLRVEADGVALVDLDQQVDTVRVTPSADAAGLAQVEVRPASTADRTAHDAEAASATWLRARARTVTVSGADFTYRADALVTGPVRTRTWTVREGAWGLTLPGPG